MESKCQGHSKEDSHSLVSETILSSLNASILAPEEIVPFYILEGLQRSYQLLIIVHPVSPEE